MSCTYEFMGKLYTKEQLVKLLQDKGIQNKINILQSKLSADEISYSPMEEISEEFTEDDFGSPFVNYANSSETELDTEMVLPYDKLIKFKEGLLRDLKNRNANLKSIIDKTTDKTLKDKIKLQEKLQERINVLEQEIYNEKNSGEVTLKKFKFQAARELEKVQELLNPTGTFTNDYENLKEAKRIINFYTALEMSNNKIDLNKQATDVHPFFVLDELIGNDGEFILPKDVVDFFNNIANEFKKQENLFLKREKAIVENIFNANPKVKELYGELNYDEIMENLDDISYFDMYMMEVNRSVFSKSHLAPQIAVEVIQDEMAENIAEHNKFKNKLRELQPKVNEALKALGKQLAWPFRKGYSYDLFYQSDIGNVNRLVQRYAQKYFDDLSQTLYDFKNAILRAQGLASEQEFDEESLQVRKKAIANAYAEKQRWFRENTMMFDIRKLPEVQQAFPEFSALYQDDGGQHKAELIEQIGELGYKEQLNEQLKEIRKFINFRDSVQENRLEFLKAESLADLDEQQLNELKEFIAQQNPFYAAQNFYDGSLTKIGNNIVQFTMDHNVTIPRKTKGEVQKTANNKIKIVSTGIPTDYYDQKFQVIERNEALREYYNLIKDRMDVISSRFPEEVRKKLFSGSLPLIRKAVNEIFADPNIAFFQKLSKSSKMIYDNIRAGFGVNQSDPISYENFDSISNRAEPRVSTAFLNNNKDRINDRYKIQERKLNNLLKKEGIPLRLNKHIEIPTKALPFSVLKTLGEKLNIPPTTQAFEQKFGSKIKPGQVLYKITISEMMEDNSMNLPKIVEYYSLMAAEYNARQKSLPIINMIKDHYSQVKKLIKKNGEVQRTPDGKVRAEGFRDRANTSFESWFQRIVLGNTNRQDWGFTEDIGLDERKNIKERIKGFVAGRILNTEEKKQRKELNKLINEETDPEEKQKLIKQRDELGRKLAASALFDNLFSYIRYLRLGWNASSMVTNFTEGQLANMTIAATGDYFTPENYYRALNVVQQSFWKNITSILPKKARPTAMLPSAMKTAIIVDRFDILDDATNELQKASLQSPLDYFNNFSPFEGNRRVEYLNQTPLMIAIMMDTEIVGKNGQKWNLWDALNSDGTLKKEFATEENIQAWEEGVGPKAQEFKKTVGNAIVAAHGNYNKLKGMLAKETLLGKVLLMFKTWMGSQFHQRFAVEQDDLSIGAKGTKGYKGRYRSHTRASLALQGIVIGGTFGGFPGAGAGIVAGLAISMFNGKVKTETGIQAQFGFFKELLFLSKALVRKSVATPLNIISGTLTGKAIMKDFDYSAFDKREGSQFTKRDVKNLRGLIAEMNIQLAFFGLALAIKAGLWDDDDEDDDPRRIMHNILTNKINQIIDSAAMYLNPSSTINAIFGTSAVTTFLDQMGSLIVDLQNYFEGDVIATAGSNKGEMKLLKSFEKVALPSLMKDTWFGFETLGERQFVPKYYDDWFWDDEKKAQKAIDQQRVLYREYLIEQGLEKEQANKILNIYLKRPKDVIDTKSRTATESVKVAKEKVEMTPEQKQNVKKVIEELKKKNKQVEEESEITETPETPEEEN